LMPTANGQRQVSLADLLTDGIFLDGDWVESKDQDSNGDVRLIQLADIGDGTFRNRSRRFVTSKRAHEMGCTFLEVGDILVARMPEPLGRACLFPDVGQPAITAVDVCIVRPNPMRAVPTWLVRAINSPQFRESMQAYTRGTTRQRISRRNLGALTLPVLSVPEQRALVQQLDRLDRPRISAQQHLRVAREALDRFRQSVLAAACSGRLTSEWRLRHASEGVPAPVDQDIGDPDATLQLPTQWAWMTADDLRVHDRPITYGVIKLGAQMPDGVPTLRSSDVRMLRIDDSGVKRIAPKIADNYARTYLRGGEVLVTVRGSLGGVAVAQDRMRGWNISREVAMIPIGAAALPEYVALAIASLPSQQWMNNVTKGVTYTGINIRDLKRLPLPIPSLGEQREILTRVEALYSLADSVARRIDAASRATQGYAHAALAKAFEADA
jgi:type I restriction enzyme S subunit